MIKHFKYLPTINKVLLIKPHKQNSWTFEKNEQHAESFVVIANLHRSANFLIKNQRTSNPKSPQVKQELAVIAYSILQVSWQTLNIVERITIYKKNLIIEALIFCFSPLNCLFLFHF